MGKERNITFSPYEEIHQELMNYPVPSAKKVPDWYRKMSRYVDNSSKLHRIKDQGNFTIKMCVPFLDTLTCGYMITLPCDVEVNNTDPRANVFQWDTSFPVIDEHNSAQYPGFSVPKEYVEHAYKFENAWRIKTPPGYSIIITHPFNRLDLPFYTLSGIVDSDSYNENTVNLPFFLKKDFSGIIEKGTPIAQIIPFKRENWKNIINRYDPKSKFAFDILKSTLVRAYKNRFWKSKKYL